MSSQREKRRRWLRTGGLLALALSLLLNVHADPASEQREHDAKRLGITLGQVDALTKRGEEIQREYILAVKSPADVGQFQAALRKAIANIDAASKSVPNGNNLPTSFTDLFIPKTGVALNSTEGAEDMMKPGFLGLSADTFLDQNSLVFVGEAINTAPEIIMPVILERAEKFPPTPADYILYESLYEGGLEDNDIDTFGFDAHHHNPPQVPLSRASALLKMGNAKNPIYRLLAVQAAGMVEKDKAKRLNFYSTCLSETDPFIRRYLVYGIAEINNPQAAGMLKELLVAAQRDGDTGNVAYISKKLQSRSQ